VFPNGTIRIVCVQKSKSAVRMIREYRHVLRQAATGVPENADHARFNPPEMPIEKTVAFTPERDAVGIRRIAGRPI
jgi:hypothetical protein